MKPALTAPPARLATSSSPQGPRARRSALALLGALMVFITVPAAAETPASALFGIDAPQLAWPGQLGVGVRTMHLVQRAQVAVLAFDRATGSAPLENRDLAVDIWYPATTTAAMQRAVYSAAFPGEPPAPASEFRIDGTAVRDAPPAGGGYPLVIVSHGWSNDPAAMTWLTENLASKGYVVAAIHHDDPSIIDPARGMPQLVLRRPLDIAFVAVELQRALGAKLQIDPQRVALIGYSMGGYGVLTAAGATLDPAGSFNAAVPGGLLAPYVRGQRLSAAMKAPAVRAVVALAPFGGTRPWGTEGLRDLGVPTLLISGDEDRTADYQTGARAIFSQATRAQRYLLTLKGAGHAIGLNPVPDSMRSRLWDQDWFEDPVWRKQRILAINAHFITAFLGLYLKGEVDNAPYLHVTVSNASSGQWPASLPHAWETTVRGRLR